MILQLRKGTGCARTSVACCALPSLKTLSTQITANWRQSLRDAAVVLQAGVSQQGALCPLRQSQPRGPFALGVSASSVLEAGTWECRLPALRFTVLTLASVS